jgi:hypothetical protein
VRLVLDSAAALLLFALPGWLLLSWSGAARGFARRLAYGTALGIAALASALYLLSHLLHVPLTRTAVLAVAATIAAIGAAGSWRRRRTFAWPRRRARRRETATYVLAGLVTLISMGLFADALTNPPLDWDGRMTWMAHARYLRAEHTVDARAIAEPRWYVLLPRYPLLVPVAHVAIWEATGSADERLPRVFHALFYPILLAIFFDAASVVAGRRAAVLATLAAAVAPQLSTLPIGGATSGYADLPLAALSGAALAILWRGRIRCADGLIAGVLLAGAVLTKNEGLPIAILVLGAALARHLRRSRARAAVAAALAPVAIATALLLSWRAGIAPRLANEQLVVGPVGDAVRRLPAAIGTLLVETVSPRTWGAFWILVAILLVAGRSAFRLRRLRPLVLLAASLLALDLSAIVLSHVEVKLLARTAWSRLLLQDIVPLGMIFAAAITRVLGARQRRDTGMRAMLPRAH